MNKIRLNTDDDTQPEYVKVYFANKLPLQDEKLYTSVYRSLPKWRQEKADRFRFQKDRSLSVCAGALLKTALKNEGTDLNTINISFGKNDKPYIENKDIIKPLFFNLSHSGDYAMCVISSMESGCDIQKTSDKDLDQKVAEHFFHQLEKEHIQSQPTEPDKKISFYKIWAMKESYIKMKGGGMSIPLDSFCVPLSLAENSAVPDCRFELIPISDDYSAAVCLEGKNSHNPEITCTQIDLEEYY